MPDGLQPASVGGMKQFLIVATGGAGGDLPPLVAAALAIRERGHQIAFVGDPSLGRALTGLGVELQVLPAELDLGPRFASVMREAMTATNGDMVAAGPLVEQGLARWAEEIAEPIRRRVDERRFLFASAHRPLLPRRGGYHTSRELPYSYLAAGWSGRDAPESVPCALRPRATSDRP